MKNSKICILALVIILSITNAVAQTGVFTTSTFDNKIQFNPSQAGITNNVNLSMAFKTALDNSQSGLAKEFSFAADLPISESAGIGLVMYNRKGGILKQSLFNLCYSYGIKFKESLKLRFGIGAGFKNIRAENDGYENIIGDINDPTLSSYNSIPPSFYSSFSFTLQAKDLELQTVLPNLTAKLQNKNLATLDYPTMQFGLGYKKAIRMGSFFGKDSYIKAFAGMIQYNQTGTIINGGVLVSSTNALAVNLQYNTSGVLTAGLGIPIEKVIHINVNYSLGGLYSRTIYGGSGVTEINVNYSFKKKQK
jgi:hypothetical protein